MDNLDDILFDLAYQKGKSVQECLYDVYNKGRADAIEELKEKYLDADAYNEGLADGRADAIDEFAKPVMNGILHTICRMIASGDIPKDVYQKWLSDTPIGFMTPLEIYAEILREQLNEKK